MPDTADGPLRSIEQDEPESKLVRRAWLGPAIFSAVLTLAWTSYLVPVFFGIFAAAL